MNTNLPSPSLRTFPKPGWKKKPDRRTGCLLEKQEVGFFFVTTCWLAVRQVFLCLPGGAQRVLKWLPGAGAGADVW